MWTKLFWKETFERAVKTFAQTVVATPIGAGILNYSQDAVDVQPLVAALTLGGVAAGLSVLSSLASSLSGAGGKGSPSLVSEEYEAQHSAG